MARALGAGTQAAVEAQSTDLVQLLEIGASGGTTRLTTAPVDVDWNGQTWQGVGGHIGIGAVQETADDRAQGLPLELSGVDGSVVGLILTNEMRGRTCVLYWAYLDRAAGQFVADPLELFRGFLNERWTVRHQPSEPDRPGTVHVTTRAVSRLAELSRRVEVRTNPTSHREMLRRAGLTGGALNDNFFALVAGLVGKQIYWGTESPDANSPGMLTGGSRDRDHVPDDRV